VSALAGGHVERTIDAVLNALERSRAAEHGAASPGTLQRLDPRVKLAGSLLLVVSIVAATRPEAIALVFAAALAAGVASRVSLAVLATAVWLPAFFFTSAIALPALFTTPGPAVGLVPVLGWRVTAPGLRTATTP
jgi:energy-coupling factor transporter transmembrane protein EcfT